MPRPVRNVYAASAGMALAAFAVGSAQAADLGGNCCADLEERVAELEATTVRKGNRKVSLEVSGHVHEGILIFDDGIESNAYIGTPNSSRSRFRFKGSATINADWSAGFLMEFGVRANALSSVTQDRPLVNRGIDIRHEALFVKSKTLGTIWLGQTGSAAEGITEINLGGALENFPDQYHGNFQPRVNGALGVFSMNALASRQGGFTAGEGNRRTIAKYISPTFAGFSLSAAAGGDDFWDVALRYAGEFGSIRVAAGVAYQQITSNNDNDGTLASNCTALGGSDCDFSLVGSSASILHVPSGLYVAGTYGYVEDNNAVGGADRDTTYHVTAGVNAKWNALGKTNVFGLYGNYESEAYAAKNFNSEIDVWGVGVKQDIDAAAMNTYIVYKNFSFDTTDGNSYADIDQVTIGARIRF